MRPRPPPFQLVTELFKQKTGAPMQAIPYKSANETVLAVVSGQVTTTIADSGPVSPQVTPARSAHWRSRPSQQQAFSTEPARE